VRLSDKGSIILDSKRPAPPRLGLSNEHQIRPLKSAPQVADLSWMAGYWLECSPRGEATETWTDDRGGVMLGLSKSIRNGRTT